MLQRFVEKPPTPNPVALPEYKSCTLTHLWHDLRVAFCNKVIVKFPSGAVCVLSRIGRPLTGSWVALRWWWVAEQLRNWLPVSVTIDTLTFIGGGYRSFAWRGHVGSMSVVLKSDRDMVADDKSAIVSEWQLLEARLPTDRAVATGLPIPAYHGLFVGMMHGAPVRIILMSDGGVTLDSLGDLGVSLA
ncbi:hypothetical protein BN946_scf185011.g42 [Trametes cinnabarina]|uniref:Uncharacterized protein n=1 Tax=Pycnoporus cinnabarinus TaxID=5643 RepID=A0A060SV98_PYCCI|nr:hypothetical protein BN946_scf185011.g42 [Trametes cinnabarina]